MTYEYQPLADADAEIRLAVLQPGAFNDRINIMFKVQPLHVRHSKFYYAIGL
jgi:hypothetical protein